MGKEIACSKVLFIKLGRKGKWEKECLENGRLKLGFNEANHDDCLKGSWDAIYDFWLKTFKKNSQTATSYKNQIKFFYEADGQVLWITFFGNKLWWGFAENGVKRCADGTKIRRVKGGWNCKDVNGNELRADNLSGRLLKTQGFRGTICEVPEAEYVLKKINATESAEIIETKETLARLEEKTGRLIQDLYWKDFETLIDLIFRQEGWQRVGVIGKTVKTLDLDLLLPITGERAIVQIKSESDGQECRSYLEKFKTMQGYDKFFYIVHSPKGSLQDTKTEITDKSTYLFFGKDIAELTIKAGLIHWVLGKVK